jgi:ABC-type dipeptide/oligopeptide/nickel transport system permease subunit
VVFFPTITTFAVLFPAGRRDRAARRRLDGAGRSSETALRLAGWRHEYKVALAPNPRFRRPPRSRGVSFFMVNERTVELALYERGDLDFAFLAPLDIPRFEGHPDFHRKAMLRADYYGFNCRKPPFGDPRVRRAFSRAIDRAVFPRVLHGGEIPMTSWIPPGMLAHEPGVGLALDPSRARKDLADAGFPGGRGSRGRGGPTRRRRRSWSPRLQAQWRTRRRAVRLRQVEWKAYLKEISTDPPGVWRLGWGADYPDPDNFMNLFTATSGQNHTGWSSARFDALVAAAAQETKPERRKALYDQAQRILCETDAPTCRCTAARRISRLARAARDQRDGLSLPGRGSCDFTSEGGSPGGSPSQTLAPGRPMTRAVLGRLALGVVTLWVVITLTFLFLRVVPGGPFDRERRLPPEIEANVKAKFHLDEPLAAQYARYIGSIARGDLGPSFKYLGRSVNDVLRDTFPVSAHLGLLALAWGTALGVAAGLAAGMLRGGLPDRLAMLGATMGISLPAFVVGVLLILLFAHVLGLLPPALWEGPAYTVLPALTLGLAPAAYIARLTRSGVLDDEPPYVTAARAKGVGERGWRSATCSGTRSCRW